MIEEIRDEMGHNLIRERWVNGWLVSLDPLAGSSHEPPKGA